MTPDAGTIRSSTGQRGPFTMTRDELAERAADTGWQVVGHNWLRLTRDDVAIEAWFVNGRAVSAKYRCPDGNRHVNVTQLTEPELRAKLSAVIATWCAGYPPQLRPHGSLVTIPTEPDLYPAEGHRPAAHGYHATNCTARASVAGSTTNHAAGHPGAASTTGQCDRQ